jgi:magnesium-protoporphyrin IX monomethyl ester (oxidative) cyclase
MTATAPHLREDLLTPRFYTTDLAKAARTDLAGQRPAFEAMLQEMESDYNRDHFDRKAPLDRLRDLDPEQKAAYESYLVRSCVSEFSGFLLFKELSRQLQKAQRPELSRLFNLMARDEARHAGFLNRALLAEGISIDLPALSGRRPITWFPLSWVLDSVYLSEKIGYWRYILIDRHLKAHPDNAFAPLFDFFEPWCQDENRHGDIFNVLIRCWPGLRRGLRGQAFPVVFALEDDRWFELRDRMVALHRQLGEGGPARVASWLGRLGLRLRFAALLLRQLSQPMVASEVNL